MLTKFRADYCFSKNPLIRLFLQPVLASCAGYSPIIVQRFLPTSQSSHNAYETVDDMFLSCKAAGGDFSRNLVLLSRRPPTEIFIKTKLWILVRPSEDSVQSLIEPDEAESVDFVVVVSFCPP